MAVIIVIVVTGISLIISLHHCYGLYVESHGILLFYCLLAVSDYKQSLQFQNLNEEKQNIHLEVVRGGRRLEISIFDIVVGDVIPLKIGDQVRI